jgi:hypothetical protein
LPGLSQTDLYKPLFFINSEMSVVVVDDQRRKSGASPATRQLCRHLSARIAMRAAGG